MKLSTRITLYYAIFSALLAAALMVVLYSGTANALKGTMKQQLEAAIADTKYRLVTGNHESYDDHDSDHENDYIDDDLTEDEGISLVVLREDGTVFAATDNGMWLADLAQDDDEIETKYRSRNWYVLQDDLDTEHASYTIRAAATTNLPSYRYPRGVAPLPSLPAPGPPDHGHRRGNCRGHRPLGPHSAHACQRRGGGARRYIQ